ncbi:SOS response-associated peptidase [Streptomyces sp. NPDC053750]|uniref:SOS response-associated peptidase n=1 Tax=Streptomyces sp. NPDC053750 TaxID=3365714 RepID=UPI0037D5E0D0
MCGRYVSTRSPEDLARQFQITDRDLGDPLAPSWNVAPTDEVWAVLERTPRDASADAPAARHLRTLRWGLVPSWAGDAKIGTRLINARVETLHEKPAFRTAFARRRCLLPADGFYEWQRVEDRETGKARKQPYFIHSADDHGMALAGLYEFWRDPDAGHDDPSAWLTTCTIITTEATDAAGRVHPRMPLTVAEEHYDAWLDPSRQDTGTLRDLLEQPGGGRLDARPVSTAVNNVRNDGPQLVEAVTGP